MEASDELTHYTLIWNEPTYNSVITNMEVTNKITREAQEQA